VWFYVCKERTKNSTIRSRCRSLNRTISTQSTISLTGMLGAVHKVRHARGAEGGPRKCDSLWRGRRVQEHVTSHFTKMCPTYETWNRKSWLTFCCNGGILTEGEWTKTTSDKTFQTKNLEQSPRTKTPRTIERYFVQGVFLGFFVLLKNRGVRDVWRTLGGSRKVWQSVTGGQNLSKIAWHTLWTAPCLFLKRRMWTLLILRSLWMRRHRPTAKSWLC